VRGAARVACVHGAARTTSEDEKKVMNSQEADGGSSV
jgi:hypothetical protein